MKALVLILTLLFIYSCGEYKRWPCKNNEDARTFRHPQKVKQEKQKQLDVNFKTTIGFINKISSVPLELGVKRSMNEVGLKLEKDHSFYLMLLEKYFDATTTFPCNQEFNKRYIDFIELMWKNYVELEQLRTSFANTFGLLSDSTFSKSSSISIGEVNIVINSFNNNYDSLNKRVKLLESEISKVGDLKDELIDSTKKEFGSVCFTNQSVAGGFGTKKVYIKDQITKSVVRESLISGQSNGCFQDLQVGLYLVEIYYIHAMSGEIASLKESYEIKIVANIILYFDIKQ